MRPKIIALFIGLLVIGLLIACVLRAQNKKPATLYLKYDKICLHYKKLWVPVDSSKEIMATDSLLKTVNKDVWFESLTPQDQRFRIKRIQFYNNLCRKKKSQRKFLKGWVRRAIS